MTFAELRAHIINAPLKLTFLLPRLTYFNIRHTIGPFIPKIMDFHSEKTTPMKDTFLMVANHSEPLDPAYCMISVKGYYRFIASDHLLTSIPGAPIIIALGKPLVKFQTESSDTLYEDMLLSLKNHINVMVSVEGRITNTGETGYMSKRNATLVKEAGCGLITYRFNGGYLRHPRWADNKRKGPLFGQVVHQYSAAECAAMTEDELFAIMKQDLYVNCYEDQKQNPHKYICENPAQSAEIILYGCPKCHGIGTMKTHDDTISCNCGFHARVDEYGFWHGDMDFDNIVDWDKWQKTLVKKMADEKRGVNELLISDSHQKIIKGNAPAKEVLSEDADIALYGDKFVMSYGEKTITVPLSELQKIDYAGWDELQIITNDHDYYHIYSPSYPRSAVKYQHLTRYLMGKENI